MRFLITFCLCTANIKQLHKHTTIAPRLSSVDILRAGGGGVEEGQDGGVEGEGRGVEEPQGMEVLKDKQRRIN